MTEVDRRKFIQRAGVGAAAAGAAWAGPAILGQNAAFAAGSDGGGGGGPIETIPPDPDPDDIYCGTIVWPTTNNNPNSPASRITYPLKSTDEPLVQLDSVVGQQVGPTPPSLINPQVTAGAGANYGYRNLLPNPRAFQGQGTISGCNVPGLVLVQNNAGGGNTSAASIANYQEVTFTFNTVITDLRFNINDLTANTEDGANTTGDTVDASAPYTPRNGIYRDAVSFNRSISVTGGNQTNLTGSGTFSNPLRRTTDQDYFIGLNAVYAPNNVPLDVEVTMPGPLKSFTMRYATVGGRGTQWVQLGTFSFGDC
ncbi:twin-arginine translocation signal domain-containing protein [Candidatus Microthrix parvicella]|uniref:twin-arginine translocation signal domain-containing protein n=1 Tax=Candidatus Neomicrothrix parvicella TaxID=41950 RepID=UPI000377BEBF|nr:twin-arginine translocation signal domain-containing protein [Candidatus Microthrix parvicella]